MDDKWQRALDAYLTEIHSRSGSQQSLLDYRWILAPFCALHPDPSKVTAFDVHTYVYRPTRYGKAPMPATIHARLHPLLGFFRRLVSWGLIPISPAEHVQRPKIPKTVARWLTPPEVARLLSIIPYVLATTRWRDRREARDRAMILTAFYTALRATEVCSLTAGAINGAWDSPGGNVFAAVRTKGGDMRQIFLPPPVVEAIRLAVAIRGYSLHQLPAEECVWGWMDRSLFGRMVRRYGKAAGLGKVSPHMLRHGISRWLDEHGAPLREIQEALGHQSRASTEIYIRRFPPKPTERWREIEAAMREAS